MAKMTQADLARELGVNRSTIKYHIDRGLSFDQIRELHQALQDCSDDDEEEEEEDENSIIYLRKEKIRREIALKQVQAEQAQVRLARDMGNLVSIEDVNELMVHVASVTKGVFQSLENKLPSKLEGLSAAEMVPILRDEVGASLVSIADEVKAVIKTLTNT